MEITGVLILIIIGIMLYLFFFLQARKKKIWFKNEHDFIHMRNRHLEEVEDKIRSLEILQIRPNENKRISFSFLTYEADNAKMLSAELSKRGYVATHFPKENSLYQVLGWTILTMSGEKIMEWTMAMCDVGVAFDCCFERWGLNFEETEYM